MVKKKKKLTLYRKRKVNLDGKRGKLGEGSNI